MNVRHKIEVVLLSFFLIFQYSFAQIVIVKGGRPKARIAVDRNDSIDMKAALLLQTFTKKNNWSNSRNSIKRKRKKR